MTDLQLDMLRAEMLLKHITMRDLAQWIGINTSTLYRKMACKKDFSLSEAKNIAKRLKLNNKQKMDIFFA